MAAFWPRLGIKSSPRGTIFSATTITAYILLLTTLHAVIKGSDGQPVPVSPNSSLYNLHAHLFDHGYKPQLRPVEGSEIVYLRTRVNFLSLDSLDVKGQRMCQTFTIDVYWLDHFLNWDPEDFGRVGKILVRREAVWTPELSLQKYVGSTPLQMGGDDDYIQIDHTGTIQWTLDLNVATACDVDTTFYPYDQQVCEWTLRSRRMTTEELVIDFACESTGMFGQSAAINAEWELLNATQHLSEMMAPPGDDPSVKLSTQTLRFTFKRRSLFLTMTLVMPALLLALLSTLVFYLPAESGEKVSLGVTLMLSFLFLLSILMDVLPRTSLNTPIFMIYVILLCSCSCLSVVLTVFVLNIHHKPDSLPLTKPALIFLSVMSAGRKVSVCLTRAFAKCCCCLGPEDSGRSVRVVAPAVEPGVPVYDKAFEVYDNEGCKKGGKVCEGGGKRKREPEAVAQQEEMTWQDVAANCDYVFSRFFLAVIFVSTLVLFRLLMKG